jgi:hypothetical protein
MQRFDVPNYGFVWLYLSRAGSTRGVVQLEIWPSVRFGVRIAVFRYPTYLLVFATPRGREFMVKRMAGRGMPYEGDP